MLITEILSTRPQRKRATNVHLENRSGESRFQVQLEEDGGGSWRETKYASPGATRHK